MSGFQRPSFHRWDTPHPTESHDLLAHVQKKQDLQQATQGKLDLQDGQLASLVVPQVPDKQVPEYTVTADEAFKKPRVPSRQLVTVYEQQQQQSEEEEQSLSNKSVLRQHRQSPLSSPEVLMPDASQLQDQNVLDQPSGMQESSASGQGSLGYLRRQLTSHGDLDPEQAPIPQSEGFLDGSSMMGLGESGDLVDGPSALFASAMRPVQISTSQPSSATVIIGGAGRGTSPAAGLDAMQLVGNSLPPSAFAAHGDPLMPVAHVTTDADSELAQSVYGSPPSSRATHGDPVYASEPFSKDLFAKNFTSRHTAAYPDKAGLDTGVTTVDAVSNTSLAAATDAARRSVRQRRQPDLRTTGGELKPGSNKHKFANTSPHRADCYGAAHAGDMLEPSITEMAEDSPLQKLTLYRSRSASDDRSASSLQANEGNGVPESVRPLHKGDSAASELLDSVKQALSNLAHPSRVKPVPANTDFGSGGPEGEGAMPERSP